MKWLNIVAGSSIPCLVLISAVALAADSPFVGHWHWNKTQSSLPPGETPPEDMVADIMRVDNAHVRWSVTVTDAQGKKDVESFDAPANGEFYPISTGATASFRLSGEELDAVFKGPGDETDSLNCTVAGDRSKMTCKGTLSQAGGKSASYVDVYDRK